MTKYLKKIEIFIPFYKKGNPNNYITMSTTMSTTINLTQNKIIKKKIKIKKKKYVLRTRLQVPYGEKEKIKIKKKKYVLRTRLQVPYGEKEKIKIKKRTQSLQLEIEAEEDEKFKTYPNQQPCAEEILNYFLNAYIIAVFVFALTQSGKTGVLLALIKLWCESKKGKLLLPRENIYIITGLSSKDWIRQTKSRFPDCLEKNIFHRGQLKKFKKHIQNKKNCLILIDEPQIAAKSGQTISKTFQELGWMNTAYLLKNDIKIVEVTATPDGVGIDVADQWPNTNYKIIKMNPGDGYTSIFNLHDSERVKQYEDLVNCIDKKNQKYDDKKSCKNINELKLDIDNFPEPKYHFIRIYTQHGEKTKENLQKIMDTSEYDYKEFDAKTTKGDWNVGPPDERDYRVNINKDLLAIKPKKHTLILVKEMLRCAQTLEKKHIGIMYERRVAKDNDSAQIQGLAGRITGYGVPDDIIVFTNIDTIHRYKKIYEADGDLKKAGVTWNSTTTKNKNGVAVPRKVTFMGEISPGKKRTVFDLKTQRYLRRKFNSFKEADDFKLEKFGSRFSKKDFDARKKDKNGRIKNSVRGKWKIINKGDIDYSYGLETGDSSNARLWVTYDGNDTVPTFVVVWKSESSSDAEEKQKNI